MEPMPPEWLRTGIWILLAGWIALFVSDVTMVAATDMSLAELLRALLVEAHSMWLVVTALGVVVLWAQYRQSLSQEQQERDQHREQLRAWKEALQDYQRWGSPDGAHRSAGLIRRLQLANQVVDLRGIHLAGANLSAFEFTRRDLSGANLAGVDLREALVEHANFQGADLSNAVLMGLDLRTAKLEDTDLTNADLSGTDLRRGTLTRTHLAGARFEGARLQGCNLGWARLPGANFQAAELLDARLPFSDLTDAVLTYARLVGADLRGADLSDADLRHALAQNANLENAKLVGASLEGADLTWANLCGADLTDVVLGYERDDRNLATNLTGARRHVNDPPVPGWVLGEDSSLRPDDADPARDGILPGPASEE